MDIEAIVDALLSRGYELTVFDGQRDVVTRSTIRENIIAGTRRAPTEYLFAHRGSGPAYGVVSFDHEADAFTASPGFETAIVAKPGPGGSIYDALGAAPSETNEKLFFQGAPDPGDRAHPLLIVDDDYDDRTDDFFIGPGFPFDLRASGRNIPGWPVKYDPLNDYSRYPLVPDPVPVPEEE